MVMKDHAKIIQDADAMAAKLGVSVNTVRSWKQRKSIPSDQWPAIISSGFATLDELSPDLAQVIARDAA